MSTPSTFQPTRGLFQDQCVLQWSTHWLTEHALILQKASSRLRRQQKCALRSHYILNVDPEKHLVGHEAVWFELNSWPTALEVETKTALDPWFAVGVSLVKIWWHCVYIQCTFCELPCAVFGNCYQACAQLQCLVLHEIFRMNHSYWYSKL